MKAVRFAVGSFLFIALFGGASIAQQRTFVSGLGNDSNPCSRTAPCRTFAQAVSQTNPGGEVVALDSAGYGPFIITKAITVEAPPGVYAGISVSSGDGVDINAGASDTVILRGLTLNNQGSSTGNGFVFNTGGTLHIENCVVSGFIGNTGVSFIGAGKLEIEDSIIRGNGNGIAISPGSGTAVAVIDHVRIEGGGTALSVFDRSKVVVRNSVASDTMNTGFDAIAGLAGPIELNIENCVAFNNANAGIASNGGGGQTVTVRVSNSTVTNNGIGLVSQGPNAIILSRGNNTVEGNTTSTSGTIGSYSAK